MSNDGKFDTLTVTGKAEVNSLIVREGAKLSPIQQTGVIDPPDLGQPGNAHVTNLSVGAGRLTKPGKIVTHPSIEGEILIASNSIQAKATGYAQKTSPATNKTSTFSIGLQNSDLVLQPEGGNVGIGTAPTAKFHIADTDAASLRFYNFSGAPVLSIENSNPGELAVLNLQDKDKAWQLRLDGADQSKLKIYNASEMSYSLTIDQSGNVGIGTEAPEAKLDVADGDIGWGNKSRLSADQGGSIELGGDRSTPGVGTPYIDFHINNGVAEDFNTRIINNADGMLSLLAKTLFLSGNVGIGVFPSAALHVKGDLKVTGDISLENSDCAEDFDVAGKDPVEPGTVMVIDGDGALQPSQHAYDRCVAGVISGAGDLRPGITLGRQDKKAGRLPLALTGKVYCKVDADYGPVGVGDLLTTSPTCGHAMKATDSGKAFGTVIGKALRGLETGKGLIPILVALQ